MLQRFRRQGHAVVLDLAEVTFMDSTGLTTLMDAHVAAESNGCRVRDPARLARRTPGLRPRRRRSPAGRVAFTAAMESHAAPPTEPTVRIDALETFVELLSRVEADPSSDAFYSRLCEATCRLADMDRAVIFRYDGARRRVRAAGSFGIPLDTFADAQVTVETVPVARESLLEDRVIEISSDDGRGRPGRVQEPDRTSRRWSAPRWPPPAAGSA